MTRNERGSITAVVVIFTFSLLLVAGLVVDGGAIMNARREAFFAAESAARAGAQAVVPAGPNDGSMQLGAAQAEDLASQQLDLLGRQGTVEISGQSVIVEVQFERKLNVLGIAGLHSVTVHGRGEATGASGIITEGDF